MNTYLTRRTILYLIWIAFIFTVISIIVHVVTYWPGNPYTYPHGPVFPMHNQFEAWLSLNFKQSIPAWYISLLFLTGAWFCLKICWQTKRGLFIHTVAWFTLGGGCLLISINKITRWHTLLLATLYENRITWLIFGIVLLALYSCFLISLPAKTRRFLILSGALWIGTIGMDKLSEIFAGTYNDYHMTAAILGDVEGTLEMLGGVVFIYGIVEYLRISVNEKAD